MSTPARVARDTLRAYGAWSRIELGTSVAQRRRRAHRRSTTSGRHVVLIAETFPPVVTGGTYRPLALARDGTKLGWEISVVGSDPPSVTAAGRYLLAQVPEEVRVVRTPSASALPHARGVPRIDGTLAGTFEVYDRARRAFGGGRADFVVASGPSFHQFVAALYLARALGSRVVLDYRDEWTQCPFDFVAPGRTDSWWEARCLRAADLVVFVTRSQLEHQLHAFPGLERERCAVVENGWESADGSAGPTPTTAPQAQITISFVGTLAAHTSPHRFLASLEAMIHARPDLKDKLRLRFVGHKHASVIAPMERFAHPEMLECIDEVPRPEATRIMRSASALLLFNPPELARYLPGKLYAYLAARRPILVFGEGGEAATLVRQLDGGVSLEPDDPDALARAVDRLAAGTLRAPNGPTVDAWLSAHTYERTAARFFALLEARRLVSGP